MDHKNILVLENERNLSKTFHLVFKRAGYTVKIATSCEEAARCLQEEYFHIVLVNQQSLSLQLPEFLSLLPNLIKEPIHFVFLISDNQTIPRIPENRNIRVSYLSSPVDPEILLQNIAHFPADKKVTTVAEKSERIVSSLN